jgi:hypothetical protein
MGGMKQRPLPQRLGKSRAALVLALCALETLGLGVSQTSAEPAHKPGGRIGLRRAALPAPNSQPSAPAPLPLPPLPAGVEELRFEDFFKVPVGPRGLELTDRAKSLDGRRVRITGQMAREEVTTCNVTPRKDAKGRPLPAWMEALVPGRMILAPAPVLLSMCHYGLSDDLPPQTLFVSVPEKIGEPVPYVRGALTLTGVLSVGPKAESDGRISVLRLELESPWPTQNEALALGESARR